MLPEIYADQLRDWHKYENGVYRRYEPQIKHLNESLRLGMSERGGEDSPVEFAGDKIP